MTGRHEGGGAPMRTDDPVAPGIRRIRAYWITAIGLLGIIVAVIGITLYLNEKATSAQDSATLSQEETRQLREFLSDRGKQRDREKTETQAQLDQQRAVLCSAIRTLEQSARPQARRVLAKAAADLRCAALPTSTRPPTPTGTGSTARSAGDAAPAPATPQPTGTTAGAGTVSGKAPGRPDPAPTEARPTPRATPTATTAPGPTPTATRPAEPILGPVCVLGICL